MSEKGKTRGPVTSYAYIVMDKEPVEAGALPNIVLVTRNLNLAVEKVMSDPVGLQFSKKLLESAK